MNTRDLLLEARKLLAAEPAGALESEILLCHALGVSRSWVYANPDQDSGAEKRDYFLQLVRRRQLGEPIAYITGTREFWSLRLKVSPGVLIPRSETELLVETALARIPPDVRWRIADLGTGSGAIALAIAHERRNCEIHATDISDEALAIARDNARTLGMGHIHFHSGAWLAPLEGVFHCILSNPPYVAGADPHMNQGDCRFEPTIALSPGTDALASIKQIAAAALPCLENNGLLAFEHGFDQGTDCRQLIGELGYGEIETMKDLAGLERVTIGRKPRE